MVEKAGVGAPDNMMMDKDQQDGGDCEDDGFIEKVDHRWFYREGHRLRGKKLQVGRARSEQSLVMHISQIINIYQYQ